jgi:C-terminal domain on Strawberry notch homologue
MCGALACISHYSHRSNQSSAPLYRLLISGVGGERRVSHCYSILQPLLLHLLDFVKLLMCSFEQLLSTDDTVTLSLFNTHTHALIECCVEHTQRHLYSTTCTTTAVHYMHTKQQFAAAVAKRLESLGALTQGDRRASAGAQGLGLSAFNVDTKYGTKALEALFTEARTGGKTAGSEAAPAVAGIPLPPLSAAEAAASAPLVAELNRERGRSSSSSYGWRAALQAAAAPAPTAATTAANGDASSGSTDAAAAAVPEVSAYDAMVCWMQEVGLDLDEMSRGGGSGGGSSGKKGGSNVARFMNRMLGLQLERQAFLFARFGALLDAIVARARGEGAYDEVSVSCCCYHCYCYYCYCCRQFLQQTVVLLVLCCTHDIAVVASFGSSAGSQA